MKLRAAAADGVRSNWLPVESATMKYGSDGTARLSMPREAVPPGSHACIHPAESGRVMRRHAGVSISSEMSTTRKRRPPCDLYMALSAGTTLSRRAVLGAERKERERR